MSRPSKLNATPKPTFPAEGLKFLKSLKRNNDRDWFNERRSVYEESVRAPMIRLIEALAKEFARFAPEIVATPKASLFRIHRDTRFSKDKTPYKTHVAAMFSAEGLSRHVGAGFYFHISPAELWIGGGLYRPEPDTLRIVREHIAGSYQRLEAIVSTRAFKRIYGTLSGEQSSRMPRGYPSDHPAESYLRHKDWIGLRQLAPDQATSEELLDLLVESFEALHPLVEFLNEPILRQQQIQSRRDRFLP